MKKMWIFILMFIITGCSRFTSVSQTDAAMETQNIIVPSTTDFHPENYPFPIPSDIHKVIHCKPNTIDLIIDNRQIMSDYYDELKQKNGRYYVKKLMILLFPSILME